MNPLPGLAREDIEGLLEFAISGGSEFAELFVEDRSSFFYLLEEGRAEKISSGTDAGFGIRIIRSGSTFYGFSNIITRDEMMAVASTLLEDVDGAGGNYTPPGEVVSCRGEGVRIAAEDLPPGEKLELGFAADREARKVSGDIAQISVRYGDSRQLVRIFNSDGAAVEDLRRQIFLNIRAVASNRKGTQAASRSIGGNHGFEYLNPGLAADMARQTAESAVRILHAPRISGGSMPVVIGSEAGGTMVHEAIGHGLEGDSACRGQSIYSGRVGEEVASGLVTVVDDSTLEGKRGSFSFDDEGTPAGRTVLVEKGILKGFIHSRESATRSGTVSTGNGRRQSFRYRPIVRMTNTMITPGEHDPREIIQSVEKGLYVKRMGGGQVDTSSGDFVFRVNEGYRIDNGRITDPVRGATLIGNGPSILRQIDMVGNDLGFDIGTCGKDGQHVPVSDAQPTIRVPSITVGGEE
ncbi:MAG: TldD/PmbA family protein [Candidatus Latescibacteria bacterium]|nr:TldD/PmbA family protein [bacterium]MBD3425503.1 TldD/PmbA family protein [Candidatus Latescibacterota bacterium]